MAFTSDQQANLRDPAEVGGVVGKVLDAFGKPEALGLPQHLLLHVQGWIEQNNDHVGRHAGWQRRSHRERERGFWRGAMMKTTDEFYANSTCLRRAKESDEVAPVIAFLESKKAS